MNGYGYNYDSSSNNQYMDDTPYSSSSGPQPTSNLADAQYGYQHYPYDNNENYGNEDDNISDDDGAAMGAVEQEDGSTVSDAVYDEVDFDDPRIANLPRILMMGPRRAGKTSIQRVVFHKMSPHETLFRLEATQSLERAVIDHTPLCRFTIWDFPGDYYGSNTVDGSAHGDSMGAMNDDGFMDMNNYNQQQMGMDYNQQLMPGNALSMSRQPPVHGMGGRDMRNSNEKSYGNEMDGQVPDAFNSQENDADTQVFGRATALIFVLDAQDEPYDHVLQHFTETVKRAARANPHIAIEVFINKVDGELFLSDEAKYDCRRDVMQQVSDELADAGVMPESVQISYHLTSIYDHSVFEAFSRVVQKLIPQLPTLENLLNVLVSTCAMEKAYLFDVASKLYISTDSSPVDMQSVELCSDMIDVVLDVSGIYGGGDQDEGKKTIEGDATEFATGDDDEIASMTSGNLNKTGVDGDDNDTTQNSNTDGNDELVGTLISQGANPLLAYGDDDDIMEKEGDTAYDSDSASVIRLSKKMVLYLKEVDTMLALVCLTRSDNFRKRNLINYNIRCLKKALKALVNKE